METTIINIGNSRGIIIPKSFLKGFSSDKVEIIQQENGVFLKTISPVRQGWIDKIKQENINSTCLDEALIDFSNNFDKEEWTW